MKSSAEESPRTRSTDAATLSNNPNNHNIVVAGWEPRRKRSGRRDEEGKDKMSKEDGARKGKKKREGGEIRRGEKKRSQEDG